MKLIMKTIKIILTILLISLFITSCWKQPITDKNLTSKISNADYPIDTVITILDKDNVEIENFFTMENTIEKKWKCIEFFNWLKKKKDLICSTDNFRINIQILDFNE